MNNLTSKTQGTIGTEYIVSILFKYRKIAIAYVALAIISFIFSATQNSLFLPFFILSVLGLLVPTGIILSFFPNDENEIKIKLIKYVFIAGFAAVVLNAIYNLYIQIYVIESESFPTRYDTFEEIFTYIGVISNIISLNITILFLLIFIFNNLSKKIGVYLLILVIINTLLSLANYTYYSTTLLQHFNNLATLPGEFYMQTIINFYRSLFRMLVSMFATFIWIAIEIFVTKHLIKQDNISIFTSESYKIS